MIKTISGFLVLALTGFLFANIDAISEKQLRILTTLGWVITAFLSN